LGLQVTITRRTCYTLHASGPVVVYTFHVSRTIVMHIFKLFYVILKVKGGGSKPQSRVAWASFDTPGVLGGSGGFYRPRGGSLPLPRPFGRPSRVALKVL